MPHTLNELSARLPAGAVESVGQRQELVVYTGLCVDPSDIRGQHLIPYHEDGPMAAYDSLATAMQTDRKLKGHWWAEAPYPPVPWD